MFWGNILGFRDFAKQKQIQERISKEFNHFENDSFAHIGTLIFFQTKLQQTWLAASNQCLYCILDDISNNTFEIRWMIPKTEVITSGNIILKLEIFPEYKENSGLIHFGPKHRNWLYSKKLYPSANNLGDEIYSLINAWMNKNDWS